MLYNFVADSFHTGVTVEALRAKIDQNRRFHTTITGDVASSTQLETVTEMFCATQLQFLQGNNLTLFHIFFSKSPETEAAKV